jgi:hypothetical protein
LGDAGLLDVEEMTSFGSQSPSAMAKRMTWAGHEFAANARNDTVWNKVKTIVTAKGGSVSFEVLQAMVVEAAKTYFLPGVLPGRRRRSPSPGARRDGERKPSRSTGTQAVGTRIEYTPRGSFG